MTLVLEETPNAKQLDLVTSPEKMYTCSNITPFLIRRRLTDALIIAYDSADDKSFQFARTLCEAASVHNLIPIILTATKSDLNSTSVPLIIHFRCIDMQLVKNDATTFASKMGISEVVRTSTRTGSTVLLFSTVVQSIRRYKAHPDYLSETHSSFKQRSGSYFSFSFRRLFKALGLATVVCAAVWFGYSFYTTGVRSSTFSLSLTVAVLFSSTLEESWPSAGASSPPSASKEAS